MIPEATLARTETGLVPEGEGWFVLNAREVRWWQSDAFGRGCVFEGEPRFGELGINLQVLLPGLPNCMYHGEGAQEDFLVLAGECLLLVEGQERRLAAWDFVHCPPWTEHVFVGAGTAPCLILMVGARGPDDEVRYPVAAVAEPYGACVSEETSSPKEAYAPFPPWAETSYRDGDLPEG